MASPAPGHETDRRTEVRSHPTPDIAASTVRRFVRGGSLSFVGFGLGAALQFGLVVLTTRGLNPSVAGAFFEAVALVTMLGQWGQLGVSTGFERMIPQTRVLGTRGDLRRILVAGIGPVVVGGVVVAVVGLWLSGALANLLFDPHRRHAGLTYLHILLPVVPAISLTAILLSATRGWGTMRPYVAIQNIAIPAARPILMGFALALGPTAVGVGLAWSAPVVFGLIAAAAALARISSSSRHRGREDKKDVSDRHNVTRSFWRFTAPRGLSAGFLVTVTWLDVVLVGGLRSPREAAIYTATSSVAVVGSYALQAVGLAVAPQFSLLLAHDDNAGLGRLYRVSTWWMMLLAWPFYMSVIAFAPVVLRIFGGGYSGGGTALTILAFAGLINVGTGNVTILLLMAGKSGWGFANAAVALSLNVGLNLLLIPKYGITGAAVAWTVAIVVNNVAALIEVALLFRLTPFGRGYWLVAASTAACFGFVGIILRLSAGTSTLALGVAVVCGAALYGLVLVRFQQDLELSSVTEALRRRA